MRRYLALGCGLACWALALATIYACPRVRALRGWMPALAVLSVLAALGAVVVFLLAWRQRRATAASAAGLALGIGFLIVLTTSLLWPDPPPRLCLLIL